MKRNYIGKAQENQREKEKGCKKKRQIENIIFGVRNCEEEEEKDEKTRGMDRERAKQ